MQSDTAEYEMNYTYESNKPIPKSSKIKIEVSDYDTFFNGGDDLIQRTEGDIDSFLTTPICEGYKSSPIVENLIETIVIWKDETEK